MELVHSLKQCQLCCALLHVPDAAKEIKICPVACYLELTDSGRTQSPHILSSLALTTLDNFPGSFVSILCFFTGSIQIFILTGT